MIKLFKHLRTVVTHKYYVFIHCYKVGIPIQGLFHDLSKFSPIEFFVGVKYYTDGTRSPNEKEREVLGYSNAWVHHKSKNKHHFEYWTDYSMETLKLEAVKMPLKFVKEMFCDRIAASKVYKKKDYNNSEPLLYFLRSVPATTMHEDTYNFIKKMFEMLAAKGEKETFKYLKSIKSY